MVQERVFINSDNVATFICPKCHKTRNADVSKILSIQSVVKINCKCNCGHKFSTILERRRFFRKGTQLPAVCYLGDKTQRLNVIITDISRSGLKIQMSAEHSFQTGEELRIEFNLDDKDQSLVSKKVIVRSIKGKHLGAEFKSPEHYDKLGSYLMFS